VTLFDVLSRQRRLVYLLVVLASVAGVWAAATLPSAIYPELTFARVTIVATGTSLGARQQLFGVSRPTEEAVSIVPGVTRVRSRTIRGGTEINVDFSPNTEMLNALQEVRARVDQIVPDLPGGVSIQVERMTPSLFPILSYNVEGGDPATLYDIARYQIKPIVSRVPGVGRVDVLGSDVREIEVVADPARLAQQGMTFDELAAAMFTTSAESAFAASSNETRVRVEASAKKSTTVRPRSGGARRIGRDSTSITLSRSCSSCVTLVSRARICRSRSERRALVATTELSASRRSLDSAARAAVC